MADPANRQPEVNTHLVADIHLRVAHLERELAEVVARLDDLERRQ